MDPKSLEVWEMTNAQLLKAYYDWIASRWMLRYTTDDVVDKAERYLGDIKRQLGLRGYEPLYRDGETFWLPRG